MIIRKVFVKSVVGGMKEQSVAVVDKISDYLTPASVIAEPQGSTQ